MLYRIGTSSEVDKLEKAFPDDLFTELAHDIAILDCEYGEYRDYAEVGGYALVAEAKEDVAEIRKYVDYTLHPCEWATRIRNDSNYISALFLMNDDFAIMVFMPLAIAPEAILREFDERTK